MMMIATMIIMIIKFIALVEQASHAAHSVIMNTGSLEVSGTLPQCNFFQ